MPTVIKPEALLQKIKNQEAPADDYVVTLYGPSPKSWTLSDKKSEIKAHTEQMKVLEQLLKNKACPQSLTVEVKLTNDYGTWNAAARRRTPVKPLFDMIARGGCPQGLTLVLTQAESDAYLCHFEQEALVSALTSDACPEDLTLKFSDPIYVSRNYLDGNFTTPMQKAEMSYLKDIVN